MSDLSFLYPLIIAAVVFVLAVIGIVALLRAALARSIATSRPVVAAPTNTPDEL